MRIVSWLTTIPDLQDNPSRLIIAFTSQFLWTVRKILKFHNKTWLCNRTILTSIYNDRKKSKIIKNYTCKNKEICFIIHLTKAILNSQEDIFRSYKQVKNTKIFTIYSLKSENCVLFTHVSVFVLLRLKMRWNYFEILHLKRLLHTKTIYQLENDTT